MLGVKIETFKLNFSNSETVSYNFTLSYIDIPKITLNCSKNINVFSIIYILCIVNLEEKERYYSIAFVRSKKVLYWVLLVLKGLLLHPHFSLFFHLHVRMLHSFLDEPIRLTIPFFYAFFFFFLNLKLS